MKKLFILLVLFLICTSSSYSEEISVFNKSISELPIHITLPEKIKANVIAIVGGKGINNAMGKSNNYLTRNKNNFVNSDIAFYLFPNFKKSDTASYKFRASSHQVKRIKLLVEYIKTQNKHPIFILGFSRGSVDTAAYAKKFPDSLKGIIIISGVYKNQTKKAKLFSMEKIIGKSINVKTLIVHHEKDACKVTQFKYAFKFFKSLKWQKELFKYTDGKGTGRVCGPYHHHGYEGIEDKVSNDISDWIINNSN